VTALPPVLIATLLLAVSGVVAGVAARRLLRRLRRGARVPPPWCELGIASAWGATGAAAGAGAVPAGWIPVLLGLGWLGMAAAAVDVLHHRLPDALTLPALPAALVLLLPLGPAAVVRGAAGAGVAVAAYAALHLATPGAMGAGDVKLAAPVGAVLAAAGWAALVLAALVAAVFTGGVALGVALRRTRDVQTKTAEPRREGTYARRGAVPHAPSMLAAGWIVALMAAAAAPP
jgi:leader peptidase (prepilin peptidase)/N-methyltransferase